VQAQFDKAVADLAQLEFVCATVCFSLRSTDGVYLATHAHRPMYTEVRWRCDDVSAMLGSVELLNVGTAFRLILTA
jgi:hypothetical protein